MIFFIFSRLLKQIQEFVGFVKAMGLTKHVI